MGGVGWGRGVSWMGREPPFECGVGRGSGRLGRGGQ